MAISVAVATLGFDGFGDEGFAPAFELLPATTFRNVEFNCWYGRTMTPASLDSIVTRSKAIGVRPVSLHLPGFRPGPESGDLTRETARWLWMLEAARRVGLRILKTTGATRGEAGGVSALIDLLRLIAPAATAAGVTIALENHADNVLEFPSDYEEIFSAVPDPSVGLCLDTGHFAASEVDMLGVVDAFAARLAHIDLKDCAGVHGEFVPFGDGVVDFDRVLGAVVESGYSGYLVVEFPRRSEATVIADLEAGAAIARRFATDEDAALD